MDDHIPAADIRFVGQVLEAINPKAEASAQFHTSDQMCDNRMKFIREAIERHLERNAQAVKAGKTAKKIKPKAEN
jgi:hypothetical protein